MVRKGHLISLFAIQYRFMKDLLSNCKKFQYISFDIFDTLIKRIVKQPKDVFFIVQEKFISLYGNAFSINNFALKRIDAEQRARQRKKSEVTLNEIYNVLKENYDCNICEQYKTIEIETEQRVCIASPKLKEVFSYCLKAGKIIFITSDMYLPKNVIENILVANGFSGYNKLYLSCDKNKTKNSGQLFDYLLEQQNLKPGDLLHVGDNLKSDYLIPRKKGISAFHIPHTSATMLQQLFDTSSNYENSLFRFTKYTNHYTDIFSIVGYCEFGPLLYGFISWIIKQSKENKHEKVFFLSRDGFLMQKVYERLKKEDSPNSTYFYASRRALQVASIHLNPDFSYVMSHMFIPRFVTTKWLIKKWGLEPNQVINLISDFKLEEEFQGKTITQNKRVQDLYNQLKDLIVMNSRKEYEAFNEYLDLQSFSGNVAIVDIGWFGNMQNSLITMLNHMNRKTNVTGYYLGIVPNSDNQRKYQMRGYLFENKKNEELYFQFKNTLSMMELFFMAPHGSAKRYVKVGKEVTAELDEFEFKNTYTFEQIKKLQEAAILFVDKYNQRQIESFNELTYISALFKRFTNPDLGTANAFGELQMWDEKWITLAQKYSAYKWPFTPKFAIKKFKDASWKIGYLKRNIIFPLPYAKITYLLRKLLKGSSIN